MENSKLGKYQAIIISSLLLLLGLTSVVLVILESLLKWEWQSVWVFIIAIAGAIALFVGINMLYTTLSKKVRKLSVKEMTMIALQSSITVILYYFVKFNLPFFPPWLDIQISEVPALITGFAYGPYAGFLVILIRFIIKLPATITAGVGELADLILSGCLVIVSSLIYRKNRTLKGALLGTIFGIAISTVLSVFVNWLILIPAYINIAHFPLSALAGMMNYIPSLTVTEDNFMLVYILVGVIPFNLFRYFIVALVTFLLYKKTHILLKRLTK